MRVVAVVFAIGIVGCLAQDPSAQPTSDLEAPLASDGRPIQVTPSPQPESLPANEGDGASMTTSGIGSVLSGTATALTFNQAGPIDGAPPLKFVQTNAFPGRAIVSVESSLGRCTGFLYGSSIVATAGHCVSLGGLGTWVDVATVRVTAASDETTEKRYGACGATRLYSTRGWIADRDERFDYAAIRLDCPMGDHVGWLSIGWSTADEVGGAIDARGYRWTTPDAPCGNHVGSARVFCSAPGEARAVQDGQIFYFNNVDEGMSGAPVSIPAQCTECAVAIHTMSYHSDGLPPHSTLNHGTLITRPRFENLRAWRETP